MRIIKTLLLMIGAYLLGAVPFSYLVARAHGVDLRRVGSGNLGAGNVWRNVGFPAFLMAFSLDMLKGVAFTSLARRLALPPLSVVLAGLAAMLGHTFPLFMGFKGGKAVATTAGVLMVIFPQGTLLGALVWGASVAATRITSVASLLATTAVVAAAVSASVRGRLDRVYAGFVAVAGALIFVLHRANIRRLVAGSEPRIGNKPPPHGAERA